MGKVTPLQLLVLAVLEPMFYWVNIYIDYNLLKGKIFCKKSNVGVKCSARNLKNEVFEISCRTFYSYI